MEDGRPAGLFGGEDRELDVQGYGTVLAAVELRDADSGTFLGSSIVSREGRWRLENENLSASPARVIAEFRQHLDGLLDFIRNTYLPDVSQLASVYSDYFDFGSGHSNLIAFGVFEETGGSKLFSPGYVQSGIWNPFDESTTEVITEGVTYSWYDDSTNNQTPSLSETVPQYPKGEAYSWLKAPRLGGLPFEAGPLARMRSRRRSRSPKGEVPPALCER